MGVTLPGYLDEALDLIGVDWPNVDEDDYREMATAMREFADDVDDGAADAHAAIMDLIGTNEGLAVEALDRHWSKVKGTHLANLAEAGRLAATALDGVAALIEGAKLAAIAQLGILAAEIAAAVAAAPVTLGLSTLGGLAGTQACRIAVKRILKEVCEQVVEQIVNIAMGPVYEALGSMAGNLVVQLGGNALGVRDGVDLGQTAKAGREGLSEGVDGAQGAAKGAMQIDSAGGGASGGGGGGRFSMDLDTYDRAGTGLTGAGGKIRDQAGGKISRARSSHGRTRGKDAIADAANAMLDKVIDGIEQGVKTSAKHLDDNMTRGLKTMARNHEDNDRGLADHIHGIGKGGKDTPNSPKPDPTTSSSSARRGPGRGGARDQLGQDHPNNRTRTDGAVRDCGDPVDVATGRVFLRQTDIHLPGTLPLVLTRHFESSYRSGRTFGPSWASTLDQRLEFDDEGIIFVTETGLLLSYDHPVPADAEVLPVHGPRWPLRRTDQGDWAVHDPDTGHTRWFAEAAHAPGLALLDEITDRSDNRITFDYDNATGAPLAIRHSGGYHLGLSTDERGQVTAVHLAGAAPDGGDQLVMSYGHDTARNLTSVTHSSGTPTRFEYDGDHRLTAWTDTNGSRYDYTYDARHRCVAQGGADGHLRYRYAYDDTDSETSTTAATNSLGHTTRYLVNDRLQVVAVTDPAGHTTRTGYDDRDQPLTVTDQLGNTTRYAYDSDGRLTTITLPDGATVTTEYGDAGLPVAMTDPDGRWWRQEYDARGNRTALTDPSGATTHYTYDERGNLTAVTDALGAVTAVTCNAAGLLETVTDPTGRAAHYRHDAFGRVAEHTDPAGQTTRLSWTVNGCLMRRTHPDGTAESWAYDGEGNCIEHRNAAGAVTRFEYTHFDQLAARTGPDGVRFRFTYDTELRLTAVAGPGAATWTYAYDPCARLTAETDFDGRTVRYTHDAAGRLVRRTNAAGQSVTYTHDAVGNVIAKETDRGVTRYRYDRQGRLLHAGSPDTALQLTRDALARVTEETVGGRTLRYTYDAVGRCTSRTTPSAVTTVWSYDAAGRPEQLATCGRTIAFAHDAVGRETSRRFGDALTLTTDWDPVGRLIQQTMADTRCQPVQQRRYTYDPAGALLEADDLRGGTHRFTLDLAGRVTAVQAHNWTETYAYDDLGNQTTAQWPERHPDPEARGVREYDGTRIRRAGTVHYEHDAQGRVVLRRRTRLSRKPDIWRYEWDAEDRLTAVTTPDGTTWHYSYDPLGRRIAKERLPSDTAAPGPDTSRVRTEFTWDGSLLAEEKTTSPSAASALVITWEYDGIRPMTQTERRIAASGSGSDGNAGELSQEEVDARFFAIVTDLSGAPTELVTEDGELAWKTRSTLWGTTTWTQDSTAYTPLRFPGQYFDQETRLHYNFHRYYDPETARYTSPDPLGLEPAPNPVTYVHNPHTWADPLGLAPCTHYANVFVYDADGNLRTSYGLRSGNQTPEERALGFPNNSMASHTENRAARMSGGSPTRPIANDPYANLVPASPGETVVIHGTRPPCPQCRGAMNRAQEETGASFLYRWGDGMEWRAGRRGG